MQGTSADDDEERKDKSTNKEPKNKRSKEQDNKGTREHGDKRTTYCNKVKCPPLDVFFERTKGQEDRIIWRAKLHPKQAPCKGRVLMTRKQKNKKTILIKYKRTREQDINISWITTNKEHTMTRTKEDTEAENRRTREQRIKITNTREQGDT
jgi:hypothetical protein